MVELSLVIPCYNEEKNVERVASGLVRELDGSGIAYELILVDNGSSDSTGKKIEELAQRNKRIKQVTVAVNKGYGHGILEGMKRSCGDCLGFSDGDDQIPMDAIVRLYREMKKEGAYVGKTFRISREDGILRKAAAWCYGALLSLLFFTDLSDANGKPKLMRREFYEAANLTSKDWFIDTEILLKAKKVGYGICAVPINFKKRKAGASNICASVVFEFLKNILKYKFGKI